MPAERYRMMAVVRVHEDGSNDYDPEFEAEQRMKFDDQQKQLRLDQASGAPQSHKRGKTGKRAAAKT